MAKMTFKGFFKQYKDLWHRKDVRWKKLLYPYPIDPETMTAEEVNWCKRYNRTIWGILGGLSLPALIVAFPRFWPMLSVVLILLGFLVAFCALRQNFQVKKSPAGRKTPTPIASFADCFTDKAFFAKVNDYIIGGHDKEHPMDSPEGQELLNFILKHGQYLRPRLSFHRMSALLIKDYYPKDVLSFNTPDALRLAKPHQADKQKVEWYFQETSK